MAMTCITGGRECTGCMHCLDRYDEEEMEIAVGEQNLLPLAVREAMRERESE